MSILGSSNMYDDWSEERPAFEDDPIEFVSASNPSPYTRSVRTPPYLHRSSDPQPFHGTPFATRPFGYPSSEPSPENFASTYRGTPKDKGCYYDRANREHEDCQIRLHKKYKREIEIQRAKTKRAEEKAELRGMRLVHCFIEAKKYEDAEKVYHEVLEARDPARPEDELFLQLKHSFAAMLQQQNKLDHAESVSRAVWESRKQTADPPSEGFKESHRQLCSILCAIGKHKEAEKMNRSMCQGETMDLWALENGDEVCQRLRDQGEIKRAMEMQEQVYEERQKQSGRDGSKIQSGFRLIADLRKLSANTDNRGGTDAERRLNIGNKQSYESRIEIVLSEIWDTRQNPESNVDILTAGHELGCARFSQNDFADAETKFRPVWDGRRHKFGDKNKETATTRIMLGKTLCRLGKQEKKREATSLLQGMLQNELLTSDAEGLSYLAQAYYALGELPNAGHVYEWILRQRTGTRQELEDAHWNLGRTLCMQGNAKNHEAERVLQDLYLQWKTSSPTSDRTLQCGQMLAQSILTQRDKTDEALNRALNVALDVFKGRGASAERGTTYLNSAHLYSSLLLEAKNFPEAEKILKSVWEHQVEGVEEQKSRLKCGHLYGRALSEGRKYKEAKMVLQTVIKTHEANAGDFGEIRDTRELLEKVIVIQKEAEKKEKNRTIRRRGRPWMVGT